MPSSNRSRPSLVTTIGQVWTFFSSNVWTLTVIGAGLLTLAGVGWLLVRLVTR